MVNFKNSANQSTLKVYDQGNIIVRGNIDTNTLNIGGLNNSNWDVTATSGSVGSINGYNGANGRYGWPSGSYFKLTGSNYDNGWRCTESGLYVVSYIDTQDQWGTHSGVGNSTQGIFYGCSGTYTVPIMLNDLILVCGHLGGPNTVNATLRIKKLIKF
jgi:hypothetical protein